METPRMIFDKFTDGGKNITEQRIIKAIEYSQQKAHTSQPKDQPNGGESETVFRKVSVKEGLPKDGKPHYYILKDGSFSEKPKYSIHKEQIKIINHECDYWLEEVSIPSSKGGELPSDELWDKYSETIGEDINSLQFFSGRTVITSENYKKLISEIISTPHSKSIDVKRLMHWIDANIKVSKSIPAKTLMDSKIKATTIQVQNEFKDFVQSLSFQTKTNKP